MTEKELTKIIYELHDLGVTGIKITYDGAGDSGSIESIIYTKSNCNTVEDVNVHCASWGDDALFLLDLSYELFAKIEAFAEQQILQNIEDWWNDNGGYGNLCIHIPSGKYFIQNTIRITDIEEYFHEGTLLDKIDE